VGHNTSCTDHHFVLDLRIRLCDRPLHTHTTGGKLIVVLTNEATTTPLFDIAPHGSFGEGDGLEFNATVRTTDGLARSWRGRWASFIRQFLHVALVHFA
jgi:hypothetical protein